MNSNYDHAIITKLFPRAAVCRGAIEDDGVRRTANCMDLQGLPGRPGKGALYWDRSAGSSQKKKEEKVPTNKVCPNCGWSIFDIETMFCDKCGRRLEVAE